jgi:hypothetical protein
VRRGPYSSSSLDWASQAVARPPAPGCNLANDATRPLTFQQRSQSGQPCESHKGQDSRDAIKTSIHTVRELSCTPAKRMPSATRSPSREISWIITSFVESATPAADGEASVKRSPAFTVALACSSSPRRAKTAAPPSNLLAHRWAPSSPRSKLRQMLRAAK